MDEFTQPTPQPAIPTPPKKQFSSIGMTFIGMLAGLITVTLILIVLNYFNILHLSKIPTLSFLPHYVTDPFSLNSSVTQSQKSHTTQNQATVLTNYLSKILKKQYLPPTSSMHANGLAANWEYNSLSFAAQSATGTAQLAGMITLVIKPVNTTFYSQLVTSPTSLLTPSMATTISNTYFQAFKGLSPWSCDNNKKRIFCTQTFVNEYYKIGFGVRQVLTDPKSNLISVQACLVPAGNLLYSGKGSCL